MAGVCITSVAQTTTRYLQNIDSSRLWFGIVELFWKHQCDLLAIVGTHTQDKKGERAGEGGVPNQPARSAPQPPEGWIGEQRSCSGARAIWRPWTAALLTPTPLPALSPSTTIRVWCALLTRGSSSRVDGRPAKETIQCPPNRSHPLLSSCGSTGPPCGGGGWDSSVVNWCGSGRRRAWGQVAVEGFEPSSSLRAYARPRGGSISAPDLMWNWTLIGPISTQSCCWWEGMAGSIAPPMGLAIVESQQQQERN